MAGPNMKRDESLAGKSVKQGNYTVTYNENGYATRAVKDNGKSATSVKQTTHANDSVAHQNAYQAAQRGDWDAVGNYINEIAMATGKHYDNNPELTWDMAEANQYMRELQDQFKYDANQYYQGKYDAVYGQGAWDGGTGTGKPVYNDYSQALVDKYNASQNNAVANSDPLAGLDTDALTSLLNQYVNGGNINSMVGSGGANVGGSVAPEYSGSKWDDIMDTLANQLLSMNFTDWTKGDQYAALASRYGNQGQMSMRDVLGQMASRTGGLASSYATTAAQQQYNSWMADLEKAAMEMYGVEQGDLLDKAQLAQQYAKDDYNRYLDVLDQWNADRNFNYNVFQDQQKQLADQAEMMAAAGDFSGYKALGYTDDQIALLQQVSQGDGTVNDTPKKTGGGYNNGNLTTAQVKQLQEMLGVTADGLWGSNSKKAADGMTADEAWAAYGGRTGPSVDVSPLDYDTVLKESSAGNYGSAYNIVLNDVQAKWARGADMETLATVIERALENGDINIAGAESLMRALGMN